MAAKLGQFIAGEEGKDQWPSTFEETEGIWKRYNCEISSLGEVARVP